MKRAAALALYGLAGILRLAAAPFLLVGLVATPIVWLAGRCLDRAREWDPRLWDRGAHTDLGKPPGASR